MLFDSPASTHRVPGSPYPSSLDYNYTARPAYSHSEWYRQHAYQDPLHREHHRPRSLAQRFRDRFRSHTRSHSTSYDHRHRSREQVYSSPNKTVTWASPLLKPTHEHPRHSGYGFPQRERSYHSHRPRYDHHGYDHSNFYGPSNYSTYFNHSSYYDTHQHHPQHHYQHHYARQPHLHPRTVPVAVRPIELNPGMSIQPPVGPYRGVGPWDPVLPGTPLSITLTTDTRIIAGRMPSQQLTVGTYLWTKGVGYEGWYL